ncbi:MAG: HEAT repeat domain-containing protein, partial [Candidatus Omnitrophota bacterium]
NNGARGASSRNYANRAKRGLFVSVSSSIQRSTEFLRGLLSDSGPDVYQAAAYFLGYLGDRCAVPDLIRKISDIDPYVRQTVVESLGRIKDRRAGGVLISRLTDADYYVREAAANALEGLGLLTTRLKIKRYSIDLSDPQSHVRATAAAALRNIQDKRVVPALIQRLTDSAAYVRAAAAWSLEKLGALTKELQIIKYEADLEDRDPEVREAAAASLQEIGYPAKEELSQYFPSSSIIEENSPVSSSVCSQFKPIEVSVFFKDGSEGIISLPMEQLTMEYAGKLNNLSLRSKLLILSYTTQIEIDMEYCSKIYCSKEFKEWSNLYKVVCYYQKNIPCLQQAIRNHLKDEGISFAVSDLLEPFYSLDRFFSDNIISRIYFASENPGVLPYIVNMQRGLLNNAPLEVKAVIIELFQENFSALGWNEGIADYLKQEHSYLGSYAITDIKDVSIGKGVYDLEITQLVGQSKERHRRVFKRPESEPPSAIDLRNERAYLWCEKTFLEHAQFASLPFYYHNPKGPDLLISPLIGEESLNSALSRALAVNGVGQERVKNLPLQEEIEFVDNTPGQIKMNLNDAMEKIRDVQAAIYIRLNAAKIIADSKKWIKRNSAAKNMCIFDLHTTVSGGRYTPIEAVLIAWLNKVEALYIWDYMTFVSFHEVFKIVKYFEEIELYLGIGLFCQGKDCRGQDYGLGETVHFAGYFPRIRTTEDFAVFLCNIGRDPDYQRIQEVLKNRSQFVEGVREKINELNLGFKITYQDIQERYRGQQINVYGLSKTLFEKYKIELKAKGITKFQKLMELINQVIAELSYQGPTAMEWETIKGFVIRNNGVLSLSHPLKGPFDKQQRKKSIHDILKKNATPDVKGKERMCIR